MPYNIYDTRRKINKDPNEMNNTLCGFVRCKDCIVLPTDRLNSRGK
ncbi:MAG: hypothetical protein QOK72_10615 [Nitrososphaeraceae archaeon]|nr:hypothetical protein [Nitrososphaeraceae archaeon]